MFPLEVLPWDLSNSLIITVWLGIWVVVFMNLRFGWVLSGFVSTGYLAPMFIIQPISVAVILIEVICACFLLKLVNRIFSHLFNAAELFGIENFFVLVLISIIVRVTFDYYILPNFSSYMQDIWHIKIDYHNQLRSFGLIIIPLIAYQLLKSGVSKGLGCYFLNITIVLLITKYIVTPLVNFNISNIGYLYDHENHSVLIDAKFYIILLTAAAITARTNLKYSWNFNGILVPAFLALYWHYPIRIVLTFVETIVIFAIGSTILRIPMLANLNIEKGRLLLYFFNISFIYQIIIGHILEHFFVEVKVSDIYGIGYTIATLLAIKMYEKRELSETIVAASWVAFISVMLSSIVGFILYYTPMVISQKRLGAEIDEKIIAGEIITNRVIEYIDKPLSKILHKEGLEMYRVNDLTFNKPTKEMRNSFRKAIKLLLKHKKIDSDKDADLLEKINQLLYQSGFEISNIQNKYWMISSVFENKEKEIYIINQRKNSVALSIKVNNMTSSDFIEMGEFMFSSLNAQTLAINLSNRYILLGKESINIGHHGFFYIFNQIVHREIKNDILFIDRAVKYLTNTNKLIVNSEIDVKTVNSIKKILGNLEVIDRSKETDSFSKHLIQNSNKLIIPIQLITDTLVDYHKLEIKRESNQLLTLISRYRLEILNGSTSHFLYQFSDEKSLLYFDQEIITPIYKFIQHYDSLTKKQITNIFKTLNYKSELMGYNAIYFTDTKLNRDYLILLEKVDKDTKYWGTYIFSLNTKSKPYVVSGPRPVDELGSGKRAIQLFEKLDAEVLVLAKLIKLKNDSKRSNPLSYDNKLTLFNLVNQSWVKNKGEDILHNIHFRTAKYKENSLMTTNNLTLLPIITIPQTDPDNSPEKQIMKLFTELNIPISMADTSYFSAERDGQQNPQLSYLKLIPNKSFYVAWLPGLANTNIAVKLNQALYSQLELLKIPTINASTNDIVSNYKRKISTVKLDKDFLNMLANFITKRNVVTLENVLARWPDLVIEHVIDKYYARSSFLTVKDKLGNLLLIANLTPNSNKRIYMYDNVNTALTNFKKFFFSKSLFIFFSEKR